MKIVAFSINPLFEDRVMGGAPKHLQSIALHLGQLGHEVTVLCTRADEDQAPFHWHERVTVLPVLPFHQPFPQPYAIPAYDMAAIVQEVGQHLQDADRFYMHDGEFLFPYAYQHVPTVVSLRDNVYPETLLGGFLFQGDALVLISEYARQYFLKTVGRFFPELAARTHVIHNGLDWDHFRYTPPQSILEHIPIPADAGPIVLHPHRPEPNKGLHETIRVVDKLVHEYGFTTLKTLVPRWLEVGISAELRGFYDSITAEIDSRGLSEHFIFHEWVPQSLMPRYFSLGTVTLALGAFVESFGNAVYESLGCGTPAIPVRISSHREILPESLVDKVDYGDIDGAAAFAAAVIREKRRTSPETLAYLHTHYGVQKQREAYAELILKAERKGPLNYRFQPLTTETRFQLAPWCFQTSRGVYHDFRETYLQSAALNAALSQYPQGFAMADLHPLQISEAQVMQWLAEGYLAPLPD